MTTDVFCISYLLVPSLIFFSNIVYSLTFKKGKGSHSLHIHSKFVKAKYIYEKKIFLLGLQLSKVDLCVHNQDSQVYCFQQSDEVVKCKNTII